MPQIRSRHSKGALSIERAGRGIPKSPNRIERSGNGQVGCVASPGCDRDPVEDAPVRLCGHHLREVYEFAQDLVTERWDGAVREYVADLHDQFKPPLAVRKRPRPGSVYFVRLGDRVKIGYSENVPKRLMVIPHEEVLGVIPGTREDEQGWHQLLADYRTVGEWFRADPDVLVAIARVVSAAS